MAVAIDLFIFLLIRKGKGSAVDLAALANVMLVILTNLRLLPSFMLTGTNKYGELTEMKARRKVPWTMPNLLFFQIF